MNQGKDFISHFTSNSLTIKILILPQADHKNNVYHPLLSCASPNFPFSLPQFSELKEWLKDVISTSTTVAQELFSIM